MNFWFSCRNKQVFAAILILLCCGMLFAETHGALGHTNAISFSAAQSESSTPFNPFFKELNASGQDGSGSSCSLCFCYRLLSQSIVQQISCIIHSPFIVRSVPVRRVRLTQVYTLAIGNRSPPQA
jgi:hypothetical protein